MQANDHKVNTKNSERNEVPSFDVLQSALLRVRFFKQDAESFEAEEELSFNDLLENSLPPLIAEVESENTPNRVVLRAATEWIKAACGSLYIGIRFESNEESRSHESSTTIIDVFGGSDEDRSHVGDAEFWRAVRDIAPSITPQQWTNYVCEANIPGLVVEPDEVNEEDEGGSEDEDDWKPPHADCPNIYHSILLLTLAEQLLNKAITKGESTSGWKYDDPCSERDAIESRFVGKLNGHVWSRTPKTS